MNPLFFNRDGNVFQKIGIGVITWDKLKKGDILIAKKKLNLLIQRDYYVFVINIINKNKNFKFISLHGGFVCLESTLSIRDDDNKYNYNFLSSQTFLLNKKQFETFFTPITEREYEKYIKKDKDQWEKLK